MTTREIKVKRGVAPGRRRVHVVSLAEDEAAKRAALQSPPPPPDPKIQQERQLLRIRSTLIEAAGVCGTPLTDWHLMTYLRAFGEHPTQLVPIAAALEDCIRDIGRDGRRWTLPAVNEILERAGLAQPSDRAIAADTAARILSGVASYGTDQVVTESGQRRYRAVDHVGELGMRVALRMAGSWHGMVDIARRDNHTQLYSQLRELTLAILEICRKDVDRPARTPVPKHTANRPPAAAPGQPAQRPSEAMAKPSQTR